MFEFVAISEQCDVVKHEYQVTLYYFPECPACKRVKQFMQENNIVIPMRDVHASSQAAADLVAIGGKRQVPCLVIDGKALYESSAIIEWLKLHKNELAKPVSDSKSTL